MRKQEGGLLQTLVPFLGKAASVALPWITKAAAPLAKGALSALSNFGVSKALGKGKKSGGSVKESGGSVFSVPQDKVDQLVQYERLLTKKQKQQVLKALQKGSGINKLRISNRQKGGLLGTILASIGVPMLLNALTGKGLSVGHRKPGTYPNVYLPPKPKTGSTPSGKGLSVGKRKPGIYPKVYLPPKPKTGRGKPKKTTGKSLILGKDSPFKDIPLIGAIL